MQHRIQYVVPMIGFPYEFKKFGKVSKRCKFFFKSWFRYGVIECRSFFTCHSLFTHAAKLNNECALAIEVIQLIFSFTAMSPKWLCVLRRDIAALVLQKLLYWRMYAA